MQPRHARAKNLHLSTFARSSPLNSNHPPSKHFSKMFLVNLVSWCLAAPR